MLLTILCRLILPHGARSTALPLAVILPLLGILLLSSPPRAEAASRHSSWWPKVEAVDQDLRQQRYKPAVKAARKLARRIVKEAWHDPELGAVLAELALYQAIAAEHLDQRQDAIWYWQAAQCLDRQMRRRELSDYGEIAEVFAQYPLRKLGEAPQDIEIERARKTRNFQPAVQLETPSVPLELTNSSAAEQGSSNFEAEFIVDQSGQVSRPVIKSPLIHPVVLYATLEAFRGKVFFKPAQLDGSPVAVLMPIVMNFKASRW